MINERAKRYEGIVSPFTLQTTRMLIVGVGAIGRALATQAAAMGIGTISLVDFDKVEAANMGPQGYRPDQIGTSKVFATANDVYAINPECNCLDADGKYQVPLFGEPCRDPEEDPKHYHYVMVCVDNMEVRKEVVESVRNSLDLNLLVEARMGAEVMAVHALNSDADYKRWLSEWYPTSEAFVGGCTSKSTIYCASAAAALMLALVTQAMRNGEHLPYRVEVGLLGWQMETTYNDPSVDAAE